MIKNINAGQTEFFKLKHELRNTDMFKPAQLSYIIRFLISGALFSAVMYLTFLTTSWFFIILLSFLLGLIALQIGFMGHDAGHGAVSPKKYVNRIFGHLCFTIINGLGMNYWHSSHNAHHKHCQNPDSDPDMISDTIISLTESHVYRKKGFEKYILPYQAYYFWLVTLLYAHKLRIQSFTYLTVNFKSSKPDLLQILHYIIWLGFPVYFFNAEWWVVLLSYLTANAVMGLVLIGVFSINHLGMPVIGSDDNLSFLQHQVETSRNISNHPLFDFFFGGLNHQIEHHLFPAIPSFRLRKGRSITKRFCQTIGLNYHEEKYIPALISVTKHISRIADLEKANLKKG